MSFLILSLSKTRTFRCAAITHPGNNLGAARRVEREKLAAIALTCGRELREAAKGEVETTPNQSPMSEISR